MANATPLKAIYNTDGEGNVTTVKSLAEFTVSDVVPTVDGGTGVSQLGSIVAGSDKVTITGGSGSVINTVVIDVDLGSVSVNASQMSGTLDGGTYT